MDELTSNKSNFSNKSNIKSKSVSDLLDELFSEKDSKESIKSTNSNKSNELNQECNSNISDKKNIKLKKTKWSNLDDTWNLKLISTNFKIYDSIPDGNCQFRSIETALKNSGIKINHIKLRKMVAKYISNLNPMEFEEILLNYKLEKDNGEFVGQWNPYYIKNQKDFVKEIKKPGFNFEGDNVTLSILTKLLKVDIIIFDNQYNMIEIANEPFNNNMIILYYSKQNNYGHYGTIGLMNKKGKIQTIFKRTSLPNELLVLLDKNRYISKHIEQIYNENPKITLNLMLDTIIKRIKTKVSIKEKKDIIKIMNMWLHTQKYFKTIKK